MPEAAASPGRVASAPLGAARREPVRCTRRGVGPTTASAGSWLALALASAFAGLDAGARTVFFMVGVALACPAGDVFNRGLGGDLPARGAAFRGMVDAVVPTGALGSPLLIAILLLEAKLVAFALAISLGLHFLPFAWLYRAPADCALGALSVVVASVAPLLAPLQANTLVALAMAVLGLLAGLWIVHQNRREFVAC